MTVTNIVLTSGQSYKHFTLVIYESRVVIWGIFKSETTLESKLRSKRIYRIGRRNLTRVGLLEWYIKIVN